MAEHRRSKIKDVWASGEHTILVGDERSWHPSSWNGLILDYWLDIGWDRFPPRAIRRSPRPSGHRQSEWLSSLACQHPR
jgi:hypothetical protein